MRILCASIAVVVVTVTGCLAAPAPVDIQHSTLTIRVFKSGIFSGFAHDHAITAPLSSGTVDRERLSVEVHFEAGKLKVMDPDASVADRAKVQETMLSDKVLDVARFPEIGFTSRSVKVSGNAFLVDGDLTLHGVTRAMTFPVLLRDGHYTATLRLKQSEFGITPISLAGGSVKVKDVVEISFDIVLLER